MRSNVTNNRVIEEYGIIYLFDIVISCWISFLFQDIYIQKIDLFIDEYTLRITYSILNLILLICVSLFEKKLLINKIVILFIPIFLLFLIIILNRNFNIGVILIGLLFFTIVLYAYIYLKINIKRILYYNLIYRISMIITVISFLSVPLLYICKIPTKESTITLNNQGRKLVNNSTIDTEMNQLKFLDQNLWRNADDVQKLNTLQTIVKVESAYLGFDDVPKIKTRNMDGIILGRYKNNENIIEINYEYLCVGKINDICKTILHECRHKYQYKVIESCDLNDEEKMNLAFYSYPKKIEESLLTYPSNDYDGNAYYYSFVEIDAREYANTIIQQYNNKIPNMVER